MLLFVYGTLKSNQPANHYLTGARFVATATAGPFYRLYDMGWHPALRPSQGYEEWVWGEVYALRSPDRVLEALDAYEGRDFRRVMTRASLENGPAVMAWVYEYLRAVPSQRVISSGDWASEKAIMNLCGRG